MHKNLLWVIRLRNALHDIKLFDWTVVVTKNENSDLIVDAARKNEAWDEQGKVEDSDLHIPLLMQNKVPEGFETDDKLDVSLRPSEVIKKKIFVVVDVLITDRFFFLM